MPRRVITPRAPPLLAISISLDGLKVFTIERNRCSPSSEISVHHLAKSVFTFARNTQLD